MENGCLEDWLHPKVASTGVCQRLSLIQRLNIAIDIASGVSPSWCEMQIIHCGIKLSNVLFDAEMTEHVGDFGLARILSTAEVILQVSSIRVRGKLQPSR